MAEKRTGGYIQNLTPQKKTKTGGSSYRFNLQDSPKSSQKVLGFGSGGYAKLQEYELSRSPVKVELEWNEKYNSLVFNERTACTSASSRDVTFQFCKVEANHYGQPSKKVDTDVLNAISFPDNKEYYTVQGKIFLGDDVAKSIGEKVVKEDIHLIDYKGSVSIHIWEPLLSTIVSHSCYEFTHCRYRSFRGEKFLTTTPATTCNNITPLTVEEPAFVSTITSLKLNMFNSVGEVCKFLCCNNCKKKIIHSAKKIIKCDSCKQSFRKSDLKEDITAIIILTDSDGEQKNLHVMGDVLSSVVNIHADEDTIAEELLDLTHMLVQYNRKSNIVVKIEKEYDDINFSDGEDDKEIE